jgi:hypothetical protein
MEKLKTIELDEATARLADAIAANRRAQEANGSRYFIVPKGSTLYIVNRPAKH